MSGSGVVSKDVTDEFVLSLPDGPYDLKYVDGDSYTGWIKNGIPNGQGLHRNNSFTRSGLWKNGKLHGDNSIIYYKNGLEYRGNTVTGRRTGGPECYQIPETFQVKYQGYVGNIQLDDTVPDDAMQRFVVTFPVSCPIQTIHSFSFNFTTNTFYKNSKIIITFRDNSVFKGGVPPMIGSGQPINRIWKSTYINGDRDFFHWGHFQSYCWLVGNFQHFPDDFFNTVRNHNLTIRQLKQCVNKMDNLTFIQQVQLEDLIVHFQDNGCC